MDRRVIEHCVEINRCNQRGGRMLSVADLLEAETISEELAAYCLSVIGRGASFMVGASPGGAGKTTVMGALLNFAPPDVFLRPADGIETIRQGLSRREPRCCYICHEIGRGPYYAYLWGQALRAYFQLPEAGHMLATNLHADTYDEARDQICVENGVSPAGLQRMNLLVFLAARRSGLRIRRWISEVWESDGRSPHRLLFAAGQSFCSLGESRLATEQQLAEARRSLEAIVASGARTIEQVRAAVIA